MDTKYIFCPRCGAITKPGKDCMNCGFDIPKYDLEQQEIQKKEDAINAKAERKKQLEKKRDDEFWAKIEKKEEERNKDPFDIIDEPDVPKAKTSPFIVVLTVLASIILFVVLALGSLLITYLVKYPEAVLAFVPTESPAKGTSGHYYSVLGDFSANDDELSLEKDDEEDDNEDKGDKDGNDDDDEDDDDDDEEFDSSDYYTANHVGQGFSKQLNFKMSDLDEFTDNAVEFSDTVITDPKNDLFKASTYYSRSGSHHSDSTDRNSLKGPYMETITDSYVPCDGYSVVRHLIRFENQVEDVYVTANCAYYEIVSDKKDFKDVNEFLKCKSIEPLYDYLTRQVKSDSDNETYYYHIYVDSFVTYNNDELLSICYDYYSTRDNYYDRTMLYGANIDVQNAVMMINSDILNIDDALAKEFFDKCLKQCGDDTVLSYCSYAEIKALLQSEGLVIFFTPYGLEIGVNTHWGYYDGFYTATINDFDDYFSGKYRFDTSFGHKYHSDDYDYSDSNKGIM